MMQPLVIRLDQNEKRLLELEARRKGKPMSEIARHAIKEHLKGDPKQESGAEMLLRWAQRNEKPVKKSSVNSTNYKEYLYGPKSIKFGYLWKRKK